MVAKPILADLFGFRTTVDVVRAQVEALRQRVPFLYGILSINVIALAYTHADANPAWQVVLLPTLFVCVSTFRINVWYRMRPRRMLERELRQVVRMATASGGIMGGLFLVWALTLSGSALAPQAAGAMSEMGHAVFFVGITIISCIFMLMHLRAAALLIAVTVLLPFSIHLLCSFRQIEIAIGLNMLVVTVAVLYVAISFSKHFEHSVVAASDLLRLSAANARLAASDVLTSLPNRRQFFAELSAAERGGAPFAVIVCDLDGFKQINDVYGHHAGDEVLCQVGQRLLSAVPEGSCVARMGGDEFACLLVGEQSRVAQTVAERLVAACSAPFVAKAFTAQVGASAGICFHSRVAGEQSLAYERADYALFQAKRSGRGCVETFSGVHDESIRRESRIAHLLRSADLETEMTPVFQPIVDAVNFEVRAFEALVRWNSPEIGPVGPHEFIPIAERTDLIFAISRRMLRAALSRAATWPERIELKVNLSVRDLTSAAQIATLMNELARSGVRPERVTLEVTETIFAESIDQIRSGLDLIRRTGCRIAIDDFGVGYSSLNYIHMLEPDVIKIDRCFVADVINNDATRRIVRTIIELARNVGARTVAEGVESAEQARCLRELGCDELQGFHFSRPVAADRCAELAGHRVDPAPDRAPPVAIPDRRERLPEPVSAPAPEAVM